MLRYYFADLHNGLLPFRFSAGSWRKSNCIITRVTWARFIHSENTHVVKDWNHWTNRSNRMWIHDKSNYLVLYVGIAPVPTLDCGIVYEICTILMLINVSSFFADNRCYLKRNRYFGPLRFHKITLIKALHLHVNNYVKLLFIKQTVVFLCRK